MLTASRALTLSASAAPELPHVDALEELYRIGCRPRAGELIMIAGRSGAQKSGLALWYVAQMGLPTLYLSADMSPRQAAVRLACTMTGHYTEQVEQGMQTPQGQRFYREATGDLPITFSFGSPIRWRTLEDELDAWVELHNSHPSVVVVDNLMDVDGASADYQAQMEAMQSISDLKREIDATVIVLHHASDKSWEAKSDPWKPPGRNEIKGGMSEKPELVLSVALDPSSMGFRIACLKQRMGPSDPTGNTYALLRAYPEKTQFGPYYDGITPL